jgi:uncharacterized protein YndB with AHSA1/START domain
MAMRSTRISRHVNAPRANVYRALVDARTVARWMVPSGMTSHVHVSPVDNATGWQMALDKLAALGEAS